MNFSSVQRILGILLMVFSLTMLPPIVVSLWYQDGAVPPFSLAFLLTFLAGALSWAPVKGRKKLRLRDGFMVVVMFWTVLGLTGSLPFILATNPHMSLTDSVFESVSGLTTTGATVITGLDHLPKSVLYYRQQLQWLGDGNYRVGGCRAADAGYRWYAALPGGDARSDEGLEADTPHHRKQPRRSGTSISV